MRKMNFLTVIAILFVGASSIYAQQQGCNENRLNPAAGIPHVYEVSIDNTNGYNAGGVYQWYVTKNAADLMNGAMDDNTDFVATPPSTELSTYNSENDTKNKLGLTWKPEAVIYGKPYFLVLKYSENNGVCKAMNMKVMKIKPLNQFKLSIKPVKDEAGTEFDTGKKAEVCAADVDSAVYNDANEEVTYTYGENTLYYKITATGFVGKWKPQIKIPALKETEGQKYVSVQWATIGSSDWKNFDSFKADSSEQELVSTDLATIPQPATGLPTQSYIVKIVIDNERFETLADQTLNVATDGTYGGTNNDVLNDRKDDCSNDEAKFGDKEDYTIKARPTITATSGVFIQEVH